MAKFRRGFVTNSSSSSFVIAYKEIIEIDEDTLKRYPFLKNYNNFIKDLIFSDGESRCSYETDSPDVYDNIEDFNDFFFERWGYDEQTLEEVLEDEDMLDFCVGLYYD